MAQDNYTGQDDGYLSTDPYAGEAHTTDVSWNTTPNPTPGDFGQYSHDFTPPEYRPPTTDPNAPPGGSPSLAAGMTRDQVTAYVTNLYKQKGVTPNSTDIGYWTDRYFDPAYNGDVTYWNNKLNNENESFGYSGGGSGGAGGVGSLWNHMPTLADIQGIPGYQEALAEGKRSYETGAASKGTILNGRTIAGEGNAVANQVLSQFYFPYAQQNYLNNQGNANNLYNLASLGLNGSSVGAA